MSKRKNKKKKSNNGDYISLKEAARFSGQPVSTIRSLCESGTIKANRGKNNNWSVQQSSLRSYWFHYWRDDSAW